VITGASSGIGREFARQIAASAINVARGLADYHGDEAWTSTA
jgi:NADP-dependent 3-hydroxy acid dehydrogenase YdfG